MANGAMTHGDRIYRNIQLGNGLIRLTERGQSSPSRPQHHKKLHLAGQGFKSVSLTAGSNPEQYEREERSGVDRMDGARACLCCASVRRIMRGLMTVSAGSRWPGE